MSELEFCVKCGRPLHGGDAFCAKCGQARPGHVQAAKAVTAKVAKPEHRLFTFPISDWTWREWIIVALASIVLLAIVTNQNGPTETKPSASTSQPTHCDGTHPTSTACEECTKFALAWIQEVRGTEGYGNVQLGLPSWPDEPTTVALVGDDINRAFVVSIMADDSLITVARSQQCTRLRFQQGLVFGEHWTYSITPTVKRIEGKEEFQPATHD
jgi:hypothetical protein